MGFAQVTTVKYMVTDIGAVWIGLPDSQTVGVIGIAYGMVFPGADALQLAALRPAESITAVIG